MILYVTVPTGGKSTQKLFVEGWNAGKQYVPIPSAQAVTCYSTVSIKNTEFLWAMGYTHVTMRDGMENMIPLVDRKP